MIKKYIYNNNKRVCKRLMEEGDNSFLVEEIKLVNQLLKIGITKERLIKLYDILYADCPSSYNAAEAKNEHELAWEK